ncbi:unnamed protein product [Arctia plantaginis]|uniref:ZAD domain-containing protein n=1 Tax=Arctia plantaginis TaxID=874455 RepID=A0A8S0YTT1_ARCPL|nr:unnamed protein product [Arctia plantaginis]CAB3248033.1 unnamed protein product [Arctia plantaginis]
MSNELFNFIQQISKDDFLPKKICERCVTRLEQLYEWRQNCLSTDSVLRNYAESMKIVTSTINFQVSVTKPSISTTSPGLKLVALSTAPSCLRLNL